MSLNSARNNPPDRRQDIVPDSPARIPGPPGKPVLGNWIEHRRDMLGFLARCAREYGDISSFSLFHVPYCLITHPDLIRQVLVEENPRLRKWGGLHELKVVLGKGLLTNEGDDWRRQRRLIQPAFRHDRVRDYGRIMVERTESRLDDWRDGQVLDIHAELMRITLEIVGEALFGSDMSKHARAVAAALDRLMARFEALLTGWIPIPLRWPTPGNLRARGALRRMDDVVFDIIRERVAGGNGRDDLLGRLLEAGDEEGGMTERQLRDEVVTLLLAGHETTALALSWSLMLLARHPEVEARLTAELDAVLAGRAPSVDDVERLVYTKQVIQESMRLYPPAWGMGREVVEPIELGGYTVPPGTQIFIIQYLTQRDPRFFPEPKRFLPERWAPGNEPPHRYSYVPFSGGQRSCVGMHFAMMEAVLVLACVMRRFRIELVPDHRIDLQPAVTLRPRYGIMARLRRR